MTVVMGDQLVGIQMRGEIAMPENPRIVVMTDGMLVNQLTTDPLLSGVGVLILDEIHERSLNMDHALAVLHSVSF